MTKFGKLRRWIVVQKYTLSRGYIWCQAMMIGIIFASAIKQYFPQVRFTYLVIASVIGLYTVGWLDKKFKFLHEEQSYSTEMNPRLMAGLRFAKKKEEK